MKGVLFLDKYNTAQRIIQAYERYKTSKYEIGRIVKSHRSAEEKKAAIDEIVGQNVRDIVYLERVNIIEEVKIVTGKNGEKIIAYQK